MEENKADPVGPGGRVTGIVMIMLCMWVAAVALHLVAMDGRSLIPCDACANLGFANERLPLGLELLIGLFALGGAMMFVNEINRSMGYMLTQSRTTQLVWLGGFALLALLVMASFGSLAPKTHRSEAAGSRLMNTGGASGEPRTPVVDPPPGKR